MTVDRSTTWRLGGANSPCTVENPHISTLGLLYPWFPIYDFNQLWSMYSCSVYLLNKKKKMHIGGPLQFKPVLFKG